MSPSPKKLTITWYTSPENLRILVLRTSVAKLFGALCAAVLILPVGVSSYWNYVGPTASRIEGSCDEQIAVTTKAESENPKVVGVVASSNFDSHKLRMDSGSTRTDVGSPLIVDDEKSDTQSDAKSDSLSERQQTFEEESLSSSTPESTPEPFTNETLPQGNRTDLVHAPNIDISRVATEIDPSGDLEVQFEIRNLSRVELSGKAWAVATFVSQGGSKIHVRSNPQIQSENIASPLNRRFGISFKAKALTIKSFKFSPPSDIDGSFQKITLVALPDQSVVNVGTKNSTSTGPKTPAIRTVQVSDR